MIYPAQTSMIPVAVALARFIEAHGFGGTYPFWYLGTTPVRFLTGPIIPSLLIGFHKISGLPFFDLIYVLLILSFFASSVGWGVLAAHLSKNKNIGMVVGILVFVLPWRWFSALAMAEPSVVIAKNLLPWGILAMNYYSTHKKGYTAIIAIIFLSFLLLIHTAVLFPLVVGAIGIIVAIGKEREEWKQSLVVFCAAIAVVTLWYTPGFWWTVLTNPSIGGAPGIFAIGNAVNFLKIFLPLVGALLVIFFLKKGANPLVKFSLIWLGTFGSLTLFRFFANPAFWMDWYSWLYELEIGVAIVALLKILRPLLFSQLLLPVLMTIFIYGKLGRPVLLSSTLPTGVKSLVKLNEIAGDKRVFLSGTTVFWANSLFNLKQVRGGRDEVAVNRLWRREAYEIREGINPAKTMSLLKELDVSYVLVHTEQSTEYYHDFKNLGKWEMIGRKIWEEKGDAVYTIE